MSRVVTEQATEIREFSEGLGIKVGVMMKAAHKQAEEDQKFLGKPIPTEVTKVILEKKLIDRAFTPIGKELLRKAPPLIVRRKDLEHVGPVPAVTLRHGEREMLKAYAMFYPEEVSHARVCILSGYTGETFKTYSGTLKRHQLVNSDWDNGACTDAGYALIESLIGEVPSVPASAAELLGLWCKKLRAGERALLTTLSNTKGPITIEQLGTSSGYDKPETLKTYVGTLKRLDLVDVKKDENKVEFIEIKEDLRS